MKPFCPEHREVLEAGLTEAPTLLENFFWGWLLGFGSWDQYFEELQITELTGPGHLPDDFEGIP